MTITAFTRRFLSWIGTTFWTEWRLEENAAAGLLAHYRTAPLSGIRASAGPGGRCSDRLGSQLAQRRYGLDRRQAANARRVPQVWARGGKEAVPRLSGRDRHGRRD